MNGELVGACGLLCNECEAFLATRANDGAEVERIAAVWSTTYATTVAPESVWCEGCMRAEGRTSGHAQGCAIRACARGRDLSTCADCTHYTCDKLEAFLNETADFGTRERLEAMRPIF